MWKKLLLYVCLITILCSCQKQHSAYAPPTFPEVKNIHAHRLLDELLISYPLDMAVSEDYIFILALVDIFLMFYVLSEIFDSVKCF